MKIIHYVPPIVALVLAASWLTSLRSSNRALEQENRSLQKKIKEARSSLVPQTERDRAGTTSANANRGERPSENGIQSYANWVSTSRDWNRLVLFNNNEEKHRYTAAWARLEKLASEMSGAELARAYTEMTALPVHAPFRQDLEWVMLKELETKLPEFAFSQYIAKYQSEGSAPPRIGQFNQWLARDPAAATAWYESQLATGVFDKDLNGKSPANLPFESAFIMSLLGTDPSAAEQRMNAIPPDLRGSMGSYLWDVPKENAQAFVDLLRKTMQMEEYMGVLRNNRLTEYNFTLSNDSDPQKVLRNLQNLGVTVDERSTLMVQQFSELAKYRAMRDRGNAPSREKFDGYRQYFQAVDPSSADRATGFALETYLEKSRTAGALDFVERIAMDYHGAGAGDELLIPLIEGSANGNNSFSKERARALATLITDERLRVELLQKLN
jgi:hypothetical protein